MYAGIPTVSVCINTDYCRSREDRIRSYMAKTETINDARDFARKNALTSFVLSTIKCLKYWQRNQEFAKKY